MKSRAAKSSGLRRPVAANQFSRAAKVDEHALIRIVFGFCTGAPVGSIAARNGLSAKTVRGIVLRLRARLAQPTFNRWHGALQKLPRATSLDQEFLAREAWLDTLGACHANVTCYRNFTLGNRQVRLCRACPMAPRFGAAALDEALGVVDAVRSFYDQLGIRGESQANGPAIFHLRLIHTAAVATALGASRARDGTLARPDKPGFLSVWTMLDLLLVDLAGRPI